LTAYFIVERQFAHSAKCSQVVPVFDGSGYYNLRLSDVGREMLSAEGYQNFTGPSVVCKVAREDIVINPDRNEDPISKAESGTPKSSQVIGWCQRDRVRFREGGISPNCTGAASTFIC
jgi:hypothetical protein